MLRFASLLTVIAVSLTACGTAIEDRAISGGGIGAAGGAVVGAVTGLSVLQGVLIGAGVGAGIGALTDAEDLNLGEPIWKNWPLFASKNSETNAPGSSLVASVQSGLTKIGYDPGRIDGIMGPETGAAIREYQFDHSLPLDGIPAVYLEQHILAQGR